MSCFCLLQLLFGGSKLQASGLQNGHFTTAKQHRIFKLIDKISLTSLLKFLDKMSFFLPPVVWWLQAASIKPPERTLRHSKTAPNCVPKPCSNLFTSGGSKLQASRFQNGPLATAKQHLIACRNRVQTYPEKLPNVPSEFLEKMSLFSASCSCCLVAPSCKHIRPPERTLRHSAGLNLPAKIPSRPFSIPRQVSLFYLLQLLFGGSKLQASGLQNGPFTTAKQHRIFKLIDKISLTSLLNS